MVLTLGDSPLEQDQIGLVLSSLESQFSPDFGSNLRANIEGLRALQGMDKVALESLLAKVSLISLNDDEYRRIQEKIEVLLQKNLEAAREQGLEVT